MTLTFLLQFGPREPARVQKWRLKQNLAVRSTKRRRLIHCSIHPQSSTNCAISWNFKTEAVFHSIFCIRLRNFVPAHRYSSAESQKWLISRSRNELHTLLKKYHSRNAAIIEFLSLQISELMAAFLARSFVRVSSSSIRNRLSLCTHTSVEETADEILNRILAAGEEPSLIRENCVDYIRKQCAAGNYQAAAKLPQALRCKHIFLGPLAYNFILEAAERRNDIGIVSQVFKDLLVSCGSIGLNSYLIVARAFGKHNTRGMLLEFISEICEMKLPRIDIVLNRFIHALAKCGHSDDAILVFENMKSLGCERDLVTYNTILAILGRLGQIDNMLCVFAAMKTDCLVPDIVTYNTVLHSLRKVGRLDLCLVHFKEMTEKGIQPDMLSFKALIESLGRSGNIEEALNIFDEMKHMGIQPSVHIYRALIFSLKKTGKMELALKFSREMNDLLAGSLVPSYTRN